MELLSWYLKRNCTYLTNYKGMQCIGRAKCISDIYNPRCLGVLSEAVVLQRPSFPTWVC